MKQGILLIGLGLHYSKLAYNMAKSIKKHSDIQICCITDNKDTGILEAFDNVIHPELQDTLEGYSFNPFKLKTLINDYTPFEHTIYLDVDGMALRDLTPLFRYKFKIQEVAKYTYENAHTCDMVWTNSAGKSLKDLFDAYKLPHDREYPEYNSSIIIWKTSKKNDKYFERAKKNYLDRRIPHKAIGGLYPDELAWNLTSAQLKHYSDDPGMKPIHFWWENKTMFGNDIIKNYYILGMAGGYFNGKIKHFYEVSMKQISPHWQFEPLKKIFHKNR